MTIRFPTEAANADVLGEDPAEAKDDVPKPAPGPAKQRDHRVAKGGRAAGDVSGARPRPGKDINAPGFLHERDGDKG